MKKLFDTTKEDIIKMTWDEVDELMGLMIRNGFWKEFVNYLGKPPHVIKHDHFIEQMNKNKQVDGDDVAKVLGHMDEDGKFITGEEETEYVNTGHGIPI
jgi:hypothetical protein